MTGLVLVIVLVTKFTHGAWIVVHRDAGAVLPDDVDPPPLRPGRRPSCASPSDEPTTLPSRVHAIVLVSKIHKPALRALAYARATRPSTLEALTVQVDEGDAAALQDEWDRRRDPGAAQGPRLAVSARSPGR